MLIVRLQLYREVKFVYNFISCITYRYDCFIGRNVRADSEGGDPEAQVHTTVLTEDPDQNPEEPKANLASDYREGKPRT